jgi:hypothetical protein
MKLARRRQLRPRLIYNDIVNKDDDDKMIYNQLRADFGNRHHQLRDRLRPILTLIRL